ncbi:KLTH0B05060p [Anopheles sinensis]|uniref:KLTH0B05060p n=1 Tax=Anopheles sinensis TaxID=74873 RepID=A0A084WFG2_ANOSI|nr:KLTH0B05060p [Anopheles sinensis]
MIDENALFAPYVRLNRPGVAGGEKPTRKLLVDTRRSDRNPTSFTGASALNAVNFRLALREENDHSQRKFEVRLLTVKSASRTRSLLRFRVVHRRVLE